MIVTDDMVQTALDYLNDDPPPIALARHAVTVTENKSKEIYARAFLGAFGSVDARKASAEIDPEYITAKLEEAAAILDLETHRAKSRGAEMLIEAWRSEQANVRAAERMR